MSLKEDILSRLETCPGRPLSGQALAQELGVSRSAVWKAVNALRNEGYDISSGTNRGYCLAVDCDKLSAAAIAARVSVAALPVYVYDNIDSTNSEAKRRIAQGERSFLVLADQQTGGRGRRGKSFFSPPGSGLYMSYVMRPDMALDDAVNITSYAAVCTARAIERVCSLRCGIKWVNDLYLGRKKVCGILTEAVTDLESGHVASLVVGIGINLLPSAVPAELRDIVGFLDKRGVRNALAAEIVNGLAAFSAADRSYMDDYRSYSVVLGHTVSYVSAGQVRQGTATGIDASGGLAVLLPDGSTDILRSGEISLSGIEGLK